MIRNGAIQKIKLESFSAENTPEDCSICVMLLINETGLEIVFELDAFLRDLIIPIHCSSNAQRKERLWEHTCFEIFLAQEGKPEYWEFNLSPSGDWNVYSFSDYREGMKRETSFRTLPFEVQIFSDQKLRLEIAIDSEFIKGFSSIDIGLSAVIERKGGGKSYWAVSHPAEIPDFHAREGFKSL